jgi:cobyrinic acid a,c-diamide synthase
MHNAIRAAHARGLPMLAECGGMMALFDNLVDKEGQTHRMAGLLPGTVTMQNDWRQSAIRPLSYLRGRHGRPAGTRTHVSLLDHRHSADPAPARAVTAR